MVVQRLVDIHLHLLLGASIHPTNQLGVDDMNDDVTRGVYVLVSLAGELPRKKIPFGATNHDFSICFLFLFVLFYLYVSLYPTLLATAGSGQHTGASKF